MKLEERGVLKLVRQLRLLDLVNGHQWGDCLEIDCSDEDPYTSDSEFESYYGLLPSKKRRRFWLGFFEIRDDGCPHPPFEGG